MGDPVVIRSRLRSPVPGIRTVWVFTGTYESVRHQGQTRRFLVAYLTPPRCLPEQHCRHDVGAPTGEKAKLAALKEHRNICEMRERADG